MQFIFVLFISARRLVCPKEFSLLTSKKPERIFESNSVTFIRIRNFPDHYSPKIERAFGYNGFIQRPAERYKLLVRLGIILAIYNSHQTGYLKNIR